MAINYNVGYLPQSLYDNIGNAYADQIRNRNERRMRMHESLANALGAVAGAYAKKGDKKAEDFTKSYERSRKKITDQLANQDPRDPAYQENINLLNLMDQEYETALSGYNDSGFLGSRLGRDSQNLQLGDWQGFQYPVEASKAAWALKDKEKEIQQLTDALDQRERNRIKAGLDNAALLRQNEVLDYEAMTIPTVNREEQLGDIRKKDTLEIQDDSQDFQSQQQKDRHTQQDKNQLAGHNQQIKMAGINFSNSKELEKLRDKNIRNRMELEKELNKITPEEAEAKLQAGYRKAFQDYFFEIQPEGGFLDEIEERNAFNKAREFADELWGPSAQYKPSAADSEAGLGIPENPNTPTPPTLAQQSEGILPPSLRPLPEEEINQGLALAEKFDVPESRQLEAISANLLTLENSMGKANTPEEQMAIQRQITELQQQARPLIERLDSLDKMDPRMRQGALRQSKQDDRPVDNTPRGRNAQRLREQAETNETLKVVERISAVANLAATQGLVSPEITAQLQSKIEQYQQNPQNKDVYQDILALNELIMRSGRQ